MMSVIHSSPEYDGDLETSKIGGFCFPTSMFENRVDRILQSEKLADGWRIFA